MKENFNLSDLSVRCSGQTGARMKKYMVAKYIRLSMEDLDLCNSEEKAESVSISNQRNFIDTFIEQGENFREQKSRNLWMTDIPALILTDRR